MVSKLRIIWKQTVAAAGARHGRPIVDPNQAVLGVTPLMVAAANGHFEIVQLLVDLKDETTNAWAVDLFAKDTEGLTARDWCQGDGHEKVCKRPATCAHSFCM